MQRQNANEDWTLLKDKANLYCEFKLEVHVTMIDGGWKRGLITEVRDNSFILNENVDGIKPVMFAEVMAIEKRLYKK